MSEDRPEYGPRRTFRAVHDHELLADGQGARLPAGELLAGCGALRVEALDPPGPGGASHLYGISGYEANKNPAVTAHGLDRALSSVVLPFQNGPIPQVGVNGVTHEALLAVVIDRLRSFQKGPLACRENALAITKLQEAMHWLHARTRDRNERCVEGTLQS